MIRAATPFDIEQVIMNENSPNFRLSYCSPLLQDSLLYNFGLSGELLATSQSVSNSVSPNLDDLSKLLSLFHKTNTLVILCSLTHEQWSSYWS